MGLQNGFRKLHAAANFFEILRFSALSSLLLEHSLIFCTVIFKSNHWHYCFFRVSINTLSVQGNVEGPWETRTPKLFWRGRDSNKHRLDLIKLSRQHPELFNVSLTNFFFHKDEMNVYGPKAEHISFYKFFDVSI